MNVTTITLAKSTRDELQAMKQEQACQNYNDTVAWLLEEVSTDN